MIQQRGNMDWMLKELADDVPSIHQIVVLSADGLRIARHGGDPDVADRLAAACAGLQSLAAAVATEIPYSDGLMKLVVIEDHRRFFYLMARVPAPTSQSWRRDGRRRTGGRPHARHGRPYRRAPDQSPAPRRAGRMSPPRRERRKADPAVSDPERLYVITGAPDGERAALDLVTMVVAQAEPSPTVQPEQAAILRLCKAPLSVAEISAYLSLPFSVVTSLLTELLATELIESRAPIVRAALPDRSLLEAVMHGLQKL